MIALGSATAGDDDLRKRAYRANLGDQLLGTEVRDLSELATPGLQQLLGVLAVWAVRHGVDGVCIAHR
ncbi:hypothetical protein phiK7B1_163 [Pseudomonas phage phiK7B1]|nr:hypothetical protein phiK7B1_163 [Pseudomonas phage phiK7B1]